MLLVGLAGYQVGDKEGRINGEHQLLKDPDVTESLDLI